VHAVIEDDRLYCVETGTTVYVKTQDEKESIFVQLARYRYYS
jgi:hypothetical protein